MNAPDQDELDVRLARVVYGRVARRWCRFFRADGRWEVWGLALGAEDLARDGWALLHCYVPDPRYPHEWAPVPAFGEDGGRMLAALEAYCARRDCYISARHDPQSALAWHVVIGTDTPRRQARAEGSTFALAARAAVLAMEDGR